MGPNKVWTMKIRKQILIYILHPFTICIYRLYYTEKSSFLSNLDDIQENELGFLTKFYDNRATMEDFSLKAILHAFGVKVSHFSISSCISSSRGLINVMQQLRPLHESISAKLMSPLSFIQHHYRKNLSKFSYDY